MITIFAKIMRTKKYLLVGVLASALFSAPATVCGAEPTCAERLHGLLIPDWLSWVDHDTGRRYYANLEDPGDMRVNLNKVRLFQRVMSVNANLPLEVVVAMTENFFGPDPVTLMNLADGAVGFFGSLDDNAAKVLTPEFGFNLPNAYNYGRSNINPGALTVDVVRELARRTFEIQSVNDDGTLIVRTFGYRAPGRIVGPFTDSFDPEVRRKMQAMGITLEPATGGRVRIVYPDYTTNPQLHPETQLQRLVDDLNRFVENKYPTRYIVAYAVQQLLIIHPFSDLNGRTARLLGQILFEKLDRGMAEGGQSTMIFPPEFHQELNYSLRALVEKLFPDPPNSFERISARTFDDFATQVYLISGVLPEVRRVGAAAPRADHPFGNFAIDGTPVTYNDLPAAAKKLTDPFATVLWYGCPTCTNVDSLKNVETRFRYGLSKINRPNRDLKAQIVGQKACNASEGGDVTAFYPTSENVHSASYFSMDAQRNTGVIYVIDVKGAPFLNVNKAFEAIGRTNPNAQEKEFVFDSVIAPSRYIAAVVVKRHPQEHYRHEVVSVFVNPNYRPQP